MKRKLFYQVVQFYIKYFKKGEILKILKSGRSFLSIREKPQQSISS